MHQTCLFIVWGLGAVRREVRKGIPALCLSAPCKIQKELDVPEAEHKHGTQIQSLRLMCSAILLEIQLRERITNWHLINHCLSKNILKWPKQCDVMVIIKVMPKNVKILKLSMYLKFKYIFTIKSHMEAKMYLLLFAKVFFPSFYAI